MVYNNQNYYVFGLCAAFGIPKSRKHKLSETEYNSGVQLPLST
jgi:hypothetical protein